MRRWAKALRLADIAAVLLLAYFSWQIYIDLTEVPEAYFTVNTVEVADRPVGEDNPVVYGRVIEQPFWASWAAKIKAVGDDRVACIGTGRHYYEPTDVITEVTLSWFVEKDCALPVGDYIMSTVWTLDNGLSVRNTSNVFRVLPPMPPPAWDEPP